MTVYNKLKIAMLAVFATQTLHAITLEPVQILSGPGELLYAEMSFSQADPSSNLRVELATPEDLMGLGATSQNPAQLNFFTRRNGQGSGVIVITSSRPFTQPELDIVLKIKEGQGTRLQQIRKPIQGKRSATTMQASNEKPLTPQFIVSEKDIALNLPESTQYSIPVPDQTLNHSHSPITSSSRSITDHSSQPLVINVAPPPELHASSPKPGQHIRQPSGSVPTSTQEKQPVPVKATVQAPVTASSTPVEPAVTPEILHPKSTVASLKADNKATEQKLGQPQHQEKLTAKPAETKSASSPNKQTSAQKQHVVQRNESLWSIANRIASQTHQPIGQVMQQIQAQNRHAFIQGDINRLRQGVALNLSVAASIPSQPAEQKTPVIAKSAPERAKYRINQAEMNLIADNEQDSLQGSAKQSTKQAKSNAELSLKVRTAREKTVKLQQNVTEMELALKAKDQRIQLLNARLAQLQQQLKARNNAKLSTH